MIFMGLLLLAGSIYVYAVDTSQPWHSSDQIDTSIGMDVDGLLTAKGSVNIDGTGEQFLYLVSGADIIKKDGSGDARYCKDNGEDCSVAHCNRIQDTSDQFYYGSDRHVRVHSIDCPSGEKLVGGGCNCRATVGGTSTVNTLSYSYPSDDDTWTCGCVMPLDRSYIDAYAICCTA